MISNLVERITKEKDVINFNYRPVFRETCTFIEKYLYGFTWEVVISIRSYRNSAFQQALHVSSPVISVGFLRVVVFLLHRIPYTHIPATLENSAIDFKNRMCSHTDLLPRFQIFCQFQCV